ncbi:hypothetical protein JTE90_018981 [Oedothorax gibbosus]|uniref:Cytochrome c oxidase subunit I n=1 Tax=Oedothorax gibbosus TaxID=931172 RepID=A0AAV6TFQ7_9ARAC|nr:hypothetical protein JTE90_018981 [Oedothorax gibbosus]
MAFPKKYRIVRGVPLSLHWVPPSVLSRGHPHHTQLNPSPMEFAEHSVYSGAPNLPGTGKDSFEMRPKRKNNEL